MTAAIFGSSTDPASEPRPARAVQWGTPPIRWVPRGRARPRPGAPRRGSRRLAGRGAIRCRPSVRGGGGTRWRPARPCRPARPARRPGRWRSRRARDRAGSARRGPRGPPATSRRRPRPGCRARAPDRVPRGGRRRRGRRGGGPAPVRAPRAPGTARRSPPARRAPPGGNRGRWVDGWRASDRSSHLQQLTPGSRGADRPGRSGHVNG